MVKFAKKSKQLFFLINYTLYYIRHSALGNCNLLIINNYIDNFSMKILFFIFKYQSVI
ncbi:hypothetical protein THIOM_004759 [Candidatus Thiomargarita nelsonii]|uniref:Uncharacterized protein n=1 Tax=Candidatus Thiomargarita nelsonii TaxID=1003181 RepID=A0A176RV15_9GAMM|nr:hypothetical protein THIOM_004759 [Candidatus Thiomargarita nelsonii]